MLLQILVVFLAASSIIADNLCCLPYHDYAVGLSFNEVLKTDNGTQLLSVHCNASVDYVIQRTSADCYETSPYNFLFRQINDYYANMSYIYIPSVETCEKSNLGTKYEECIPEGEEVSDVYLGYKQSDYFPVKVYKVEIDGITTYISLGAEALEQNVCSVVAATIVHPQDALFESYGYYNYTAGYSDPSVFVIPKACHPDNQAQSDTRLRFKHTRSHNLKHVPFL